jgi:endonuclease/exonuclease/phosphatase family metal-dependent hydrolase
MNISVLSMNTWLLKVPIVGGKDSRFREQSLIGEFADLGADFLILQEVWHPTAQKRIYASLKNHGYCDAAFIGGHLSNGLMIVSKHPFTSVPKFLPHPSRAKGLEWFLRKGTLCVSAEVKGLGVIQLVDIHLSAAQDASIRHRELESVLDWIEQSDVALTIMAGDFNFHYKSKKDASKNWTFDGSYKKIVEDSTFQDLYRIANGSENPKEITFSNSNKYVPASEDNHVLDYIFVRAKAKVTNIHARIMFDDPPLSDHYGVYATFDLNDE